MPAIVVLAGSILLCVVLVDRPVANYMQDVVYSTALFDWAMRLFPGLLWAGGCLVALFLGVGGAVILGGARRPWMSIVLTASGAGIAGFVAAELLKFVIGRSQVYPAYLIDGTYRFTPLQALPGNGAFPSATETVSSAVLVVLWVFWPRTRAVCGVVLAIISAALIVANAHWVSDLLGGVLLGGSIGWVLARHPRVRRAVS